MIRGRVRIRTKRRKRDRGVLPGPFAVSEIARRYARIEAAYAAIRSMAVTSFGIAHVQASRR